MKAGVVATGVFALVTGAAQAQDATFAAKMRDVNASVPVPDAQTIRSGALAALDRIASQTGACAPTGVTMEAATPATSDRLLVQGIDAGHVKNAWLAYGTPVGCPDATRSRFLILHMPDETIRTTVFNPGDTLASPSLLRDASTGARLAAWVAVKAVDPARDGNDVPMLGSRVTARSADLSPDFFGSRYKGNWGEIWTFKVCGRVADVPVTFTTDGQGGAYYHFDQKGVKLH